MKNPRLKWGVPEAGAAVEMPGHESRTQNSFHSTLWSKGELKGVSSGSILKNPMLLSCSSFPIACFWFVSLSKLLYGH